MKRIVSLLSVALMAVASWAQVSYDIIPLPRSVQLSAKGEVYTLPQEAVVTYDGQNAVLASNAQLLVDFLKTDAGLTLKAQPDVKKGAAIQLKIENGKSKDKGKKGEAKSATAVQQKQAEEAKAILAAIEEAKVDVKNEIESKRESDPEDAYKLAKAYVASFPVEGVDLKSQLPDMAAKAKEHKSAK